MDKYIKYTYLNVCLANSLVGLTINALNPLFIGLLKWWMIGTKNAAVLPEPVGAQANICLFYPNWEIINKYNIYISNPYTYL